MYSIARQNCITLILFGLVFSISSSFVVFVSRMPTFAIRELITEHHTFYTAVHRTFLENCERLRLETEYPIIFGHVSGRSDLFQFKQN